MCGGIGMIDCISFHFVHFILAGDVESKDILHCDTVCFSALSFFGVNEEREWSRLFRFPIKISNVTLCVLPKHHLDHTPGHHLQRGKDQYVHNRIQVNPANSWFSPLPGPIFLCIMRRDYVAAAIQCA